MTLWQRIKSWFGFKPKAVPSKFGSSYEFYDNLAFSQTSSYPPVSQGIRNASTKERNGVFVKDDVLSAGSQQDNFPNTQSVRQTPVRSYGESECLRNHSTGNFMDGLVTGYVVSDLVETVGNFIAEDRAPVVAEVVSAPEPRFEPPASTNWNDSGTTNWGNSDTTKIDGGSSWGSGISDSISSVFSD
ncbi:hypothetical protein D3C81_526000 [compost metagenome]